LNIIELMFDCFYPGLEPFLISLYCGVHLSWVLFVTVPVSALFLSWLSSCFCWIVCILPYRLSRLAFIGASILHCMVYGMVSFSPFFLYWLSSIICWMASI
jgi:hypothetical protein